MATGLPTQEQIIELLDNEFARAGYDIETVMVDSKARPPRITVIADGDDGLDLEALAALSRRASTLLDSLDDDAVSGRYVLEVSSPGVDRPLTTEKHFRRARGRKVEMTLSDGSSVTGRVGDIVDGRLRLVVRSKQSDWTIRDIVLEQVAKAVVQVEFSSPNPRELELAGVGESGR